MSRRGECLAIATMLVDRERNIAYDEPANDFGRTAAMWSAYLGAPVAAHDVAALMILLKVSRSRHSPEIADHWIDVAGYAACGYDVRPDPTT